MNPLRLHKTKCSYQSWCIQRVPVGTEENNMCVQMKKNMFTRNCANSTWLCNQNKHKSRRCQTMDDTPREQVTWRHPAHNPAGGKGLRCITHLHHRPTARAPNVASAPALLINIDHSVAPCPYVSFPGRQRKLKNDFLPVCLSEILWNSQREEKEMRLTYFVTYFSLSNLGAFIFMLIYSCLYQVELFFVVGRFTLTWEI